MCILFKLQSVQRCVTTSQVSGYRKWNKSVHVVAIDIMAGHRLYLFLALLPILSRTCMPRAGTSTSSTNPGVGQHEAASNTAGPLADHHADRRLKTSTPFNAAVDPLMYWSWREQGGSGAPDHGGEQPSLWITGLQSLTPANVDCFPELLTLKKAVRKLLASQTMASHQERSSATASYYQCVEQQMNGDERLMHWAAIEQIEVFHFALPRMANLYLPQVRQTSAWLNIP